MTGRAERGPPNSHGLHAYLARGQGAFHQATPLTVAETASVFGETVTFGRMMDATTEPNARLALIAESLDRPARMLAYAYGPGYAGMVCTIIPSQFAGVVRTGCDSNCWNRRRERRSGVEIGYDGWSVALGGPPIRTQPLPKLPAAQERPEIERDHDANGVAVVNGDKIAYSLLDK